MANRFFPNAGHFYATHIMPVTVDCNFVVNSADTGGLGITGLSGAGVASVYMHTSQTPATGNPNPASGYIMVTLADNYTKLYAMDYSILSAGSGSDVNIDASDAALTVGQAYQISSLGTSTTADWVAVGLAKGVTPAVGAAFIAIATGAGTGTGKVQLPKATGSGLNHIEIVGLPNKTIAPVGLSVTPGTGAVIILQCLGATNSSTTTLVKTAPADGTTIALKFYLSNSTASGG